MALIGTISGSNSTSKTAITGTLVIANVTSPFPQIQQDAVLFVSGVIGGLGTAGVTVIGGDLRVSGSSYMTDVNVVGQGAIVANPYGTSAGQTSEIRLKELAANGSNYVSIKAPDSILANLNLTLPSADGTSGQVLTTDGAGILSFTTPLAPTSLPAGGDTEVQYNNSGIFGADPSFKFDSSTKILTYGTGSVYSLTASLAVKTPVLYNGLQTLTDGPTISWDLSLGSFAQVTLGGARTLAAPTNMNVGGHYTLIVKQDGAGGRTLTFNSIYKFPYGTDPIISPGINAIDIITFVSDGTSMYGSYTQDYK